MKLKVLLSSFCLCILMMSCPPAPTDTVGATPTPVIAPSTPDTAPATAPNDNLPRKRRPKNIILMIGDGMGITQISAGLYSNGNKLNLERFPYVGLHKSYSGDNLVTDSAAGATAFSAGVKTYNGAIGVDMDTVPVVTILELAEAAGLATGLVSTSSVVHATPASFVAHNRHRKNYEEIASDFLKTEVDLLIGGGAKFFNRRTMDDRQLTAELQRRNYAVDNFVKKDIQDIRPSPSKNYAYFTADAEPLPFSQGRDYLVPASRLAPDFLNKRDTKNKGFFLMIEGSQIDWGGHANKSDYHTADLIPVFAYGPGAEAFAGLYENTVIFDKMKELFGFD